MAGGGGGGKNGGSSGTPAPAATGPYSWQGAKFSNTAQPKDLPTSLLNNLGAAFKQGPQAPLPSFNPFTQQTRGLIDQGLGQVSANAGGPLADFASGKNLGAGNPYLNGMLSQTNDQVSQDVNSAFASNGRYGSDIHAEGLGTALANADNNLRYTDYQNGFNNMLGAQQAQAQNTATGLGYSGLLDSKNAEQIASNREQQAAKDPFNYISKYYGLLNSGQAGSGASNVNQPTSIWDILGTIGSTAAKFL